MVNSYLRRSVSSAYRLYRRVLGYRKKRGRPPNMQNNSGERLSWHSKMVYLRLFPVLMDSLVLRVYYRVTWQRLFATYTIIKNSTEIAVQQRLRFSEFPLVEVHRRVFSFADGDVTIVARCDGDAFALFFYGVGE